MVSTRRGTSAGPSTPPPTTTPKSKSVQKSIKKSSKKLAKTPPDASVSEDVEPAITPKGKTPGKTPKKSKAKSILKSSLKSKSTSKSQLSSPVQVSEEVESENVIEAGHAAATAIDQEEPLQSDATNTTTNDDATNTTNDTNTTTTINDDDAMEDNDAPAEVSSKKPDDYTNAEPTPDTPKSEKKDKRKKKERKRLDPAVLEKAGQHMSMNDVAVPSYPSFEGKRTTFGDDFDDDDYDDVRVPVLAKKVKKDERHVVGGVKVKALKPSLSQSRKIPDSVKDFLGEHFFGGRLKRTTGVANRNRSRGGRYKPAKNFVVSM